MVLRYKRMKGFDVWDRAGYDMHGLPTAHKIQEKYKIIKPTYVNRVLVEINNQLL